MQTLDVLLVEDEPDVRRMLVRGIERLGHRVRAVVDGLAALDAVAEAAPDVMISDVSMPRMDGLSLVRRLRADGHEFPVILCSGYTQNTVELSALGPTTHLMLKPFALSELRERLEAVAGP
ncbi:MAG: response regulator [Pseudomonadales bacterium]|jgi:two-component system response regulator (stage 0 sporulation protein F)|nr:response regulator [Pseudomonadales bacterium]